MGTNKFKEPNPIICLLHGLRVGRGKEREGEIIQLRLEWDRKWICGLASLPSDLWVGLINPFDRSYASIILLIPRT